MKNQAKIIAVALDLYFKGLSLRQISAHFETLYGIKVCYTSIYYWLVKFVTIVDEIAPTRALTNGERLAADDTMIRLRGRYLILWALLDRETKS
jgi:transposase-like protein